MSLKVKLDDGLWRKMRRRVGELDTRRLQVGVLASRGGNALHDKESGLTMIELAAIHEFGSPAANIPERSFIRRTFEKKDRETVRLLRRLAHAVVTGKMDARKALNLLGAWGASQVKATIAEGPGIPPPLAPATIERKGSSRPLVDTGRLLDSITWEVK